MPRVVVSVFEQLAQVARAARDGLLGDLARETEDGAWHRLKRQYAASTGNADPAHFADTYAQAVVCTAFFDRIWSDVLRDEHVVRWLDAQSDPLSARALADGRSLARDDAATQRLLDDLAEAHRGEVNPVTFYEGFLRVYDGKRRRRRGVYYTPIELVDFVIRRVDEILEHEFHLAHGLADCSTWSQVMVSGPAMKRGFGDETFVRILDPAMGTGAFLLGVVRRCDERFRRTYDRDRDDVRQWKWQAFVTEQLLPRLIGFELMLPALVLAQLQLAAELARTGFQFRQTGKLQFYLANTFDEPFLVERHLHGTEARVTVVLGNPPFSGVSLNRQAWLRELMHGRSPDGSRDVADYFSVDRQPLGERKHWLADDYVKFMRYGHWQLERSQAGVMGLVTNHGFLDNPTFRGMRQQLTETFSRITIVDLHGNAKNRERTPDGSVDQNVFDIEQGVTVSLMRCGVDADRDRRIEHVDLWGRRESKIKRLSEEGDRPLAPRPLQPHTPHYFLVPKQFAGSEKYERGFRLNEVMPLHSTAAVTARDRFLIAFDQQELARRLEDFCDPAVSDDELRRRYFTRTRSAKYPAGDTRGWKLRQAREQARRASDGQSLIRDLQYRPFDYRKIIWADWMVDWPRPAVTRHLLTGGNVALVVRRQSPTAAAASYFWVTDSLVLDGLIRSDNRGSESMFPLWNLDGKPSANFADEFIQACGEQLDLKWNADGNANAPNEFGPVDLVGFIYALFFCPSYRQQYASWLRIDFPRVLLPRRTDLFRALSSLGRQLVEWHLLRPRDFTHAVNAARDFRWDEAVADAEGHRGSNSTAASPPRHGKADRWSAVRFNDGGRPAMVDSGYPRYASGSVWINSRACFAPVSAAMWEFPVGTYQVCRKWLKDRGGRILSDNEVTHYCHMLTAVSQTQLLMQRIDEAIIAAGGWEQAF